MSAGVESVICKQVLVTGEVQSVGFRAGILREAKRLGGLRGWVRNIESGVEIIVQGDPQKIQIIIEWCKKGQADARIDAVQDRELQVEPHLPSFGIRKT